MKPVMRYHGAKFRLANWVMSFFPKHHTYVEPFGGAAGVLMQKPRSYSEVYNDIDKEIVNVFSVLRDECMSKELFKQLTLTPYSREDFVKCRESSKDRTEQARRTITRAFLGFGSGGSTGCNTGFRIDSARSYGTAAHLWAEYPKCIADFCDRLQGVLIENRPAIQIIENHDRKDTLFYLDPPYVLNKRVLGGNRKVYRYEMSDEEHLKLLEALLKVKGFVVLSGYESDLYNDALSGWIKHKTKSRISAGRGTATRIEVVWLNPKCAEHQHQVNLFTGAGE